MKKIAILGSGCAKCKQLEENTKAAVAAIGMEAEVVKVTDMNEIAEYGMVVTPALVVDGKVKASGKVLDAEKIAELLQK
ncbi:MAG: thioredoxin family protein [Negativicutes bacterium]|nr:thioredoxin family protein [Negativicutes bacterium]